MIEMIAGAMEALEGRRSERPCDRRRPGDRRAPRRRLLDEHIEWLDKNAKKICRLKPPKEAANGCFVAPAFYEIKSLSQLKSREFRPDPSCHPLRRRQARRGRRGDQHDRLRPDARPAEPDRHRPRLCRGACPGRQFLRQPQPDRRGGRKPAVRRRGIERHRAQGRRPALCRALRDRAGDLHRHHRGRRQRQPDGGDRGVVLRPAEAQSQQKRRDSAA